MGVRRIDTSLCSGCGICVSYCAMDVLRMDEETRKAYIQYIHDCQGCFICENVCPEGAVWCLPVFERRIPTAW